MKKTLNLGVIGIDHGHIFDMLDEMIKEGCSCNYFWTDGDPLTLQEFNKKYPNIKRTNSLIVISYLFKEKFPKLILVFSKANTFENINKLRKINFFI